MIVTEYRVVFFTRGAVGGSTKRAKDRADAERMAEELKDENPIIEWRTIHTSDWTAATPPGYGPS